MKSFAFLLLLVAACNAAVLVGKSRCTWGPSLWCESIKYAKQCHAVGHCTDAYWNRPVNSHSLQCSLCKEAFAEVAHMMEENSTKAEVEQELMSVCAQLPKSWKDECQMAISENFDLLYDEFAMMIENGENQFCMALGLCKQATEQDLQAHQVDKQATEQDLQAHQVDALLNQAKLAIAGGVLPAATVKLDVVGVEQNNCADCTAFFNDFVDVVHNQPDVVAYWQNLIVQECDLLGPAVGSLCQTELTKEFVNLLNQIASLDTKTACTKISMCGTDKAKTEAPANQCNDCKNFFTDLKVDIAGPNKITASIEGLLKEKCDQAGTLKPVCETVISKAMPGAWDLISKNPVENICETLYFCAKVSKPVEQQAPTTPVMTSALDCGDCLQLMTDLKLKELNDQHFVNNAVELAKQECQRFPSLEAELCRSAIESNVKSLLHQAQVMEVKEVCTQMHMCSADDNSTIVPSQAGDVCDDCSKFVQEWKTTINTDPQFINTVVVPKAAEAVCNLAPAFLQDICKEQVDGVIADAIRQLNTTDAGKLCTVGAMCPTTTTNGVAIVKLEREDSVNMKKATKQSLQELGGSILCETCTQVTKAIAEVVSQQSTVEEIESALMQACAHVPADYTDVCKDLIDVYTPEIIGAVAQGLAGPQLCQFIGVCSTTSVQQDDHDVTKSSGTDDDLPCEICTQVTGDLEDLLKENSTRDEIEAALEQVCEVVPSSFKSGCEAFVKTYTPQLIDLFLQDVTPQLICSTLMLCPEQLINNKAEAIISNEVRTSSVKKSGRNLPSSDLECEICMQIGHELENLIGSEATKEEIEKALDEVCGLIPGDLKDTCHNIIATYTPQLVDLLLQQLSPKEICSTLSLCPSQDLQKVEVKGEVCEVCKLVAAKLEETLAQPATQKEIEDGLEGLCELLPGEYKDECDNLIQQYTPLIIQILLAQLKPQIICASISLCQSKPHHDFNQTMEMKGRVMCEMCRIVSGKVDDLVKQKKTQEEIATALDEMCSLLPTKSRDKCVELVGTSLPLIITLVEKELTTDQVCATIGMCRHHRSYNHQDLLKIHPCEICEDFVQKVEDFITEDYTEEELISLVEKICLVVDGDMRMECVESINGYLADVVQQIVDKIPPQRVCSLMCDHRRRCWIDHVIASENEKAGNKLGFEPATSRVVEMEKKVGGGTGCDVCKLLIEYTEQTISSNSTEEEIEEALRQACHVLPDQSQQFCVDIINEYVPELVKALIDAGDPTKVCQSVGLCTEKRKLIGANPCTFGPSYWCQDKRTAIQCNATSHCIKYAW